MRPRTFKRIRKEVDELRDKIAAAVEKTPSEKKEVLRLFARIDLAVKRSS